MQATATTGNVNGSGFNPASTHFFTNLATDTNTANTSAPVISSASYNFVAGDVGSYIYIKSGTNWQTGWYPISSVATNKATLNAAIGAVIVTINANGSVTLNTTVGCTSNNTATLTSGTGGVDYSQVDAATATSSTATSVGAGSIILFAGATASMPGNIVHVISGTNFTPGWYEITAASAGVSVTTDRAVTTGVGATGVINVGGAGNFNGLEDAFQAAIPGSSIVWMKNGSYTLSASISTSSSNSTNTSPSIYIGYNSLRGDVCNGTNRPTINAAANTVTFSQYQGLYNIIGTSTSATGFVTNSGGNPNIRNCKFLNTSATTTRIAFSSPGASGIIIGSEFVSQNGIACNPGGNPATMVIGNYIHDSDTGSNSNSYHNWINNIFEGMTTVAFSGASGFNGSAFFGNTFYGRQAQMGNALSGFNQNINLTNNIFYGFSTAVSSSSNRVGQFVDYNNNYFNNGIDVSGGWVKDASDIAVNPSFAGASQLTGSTANTSASVLTDGGASFGVTDNVDYLHVVSGTGVTTGSYLITSHTSTTLTVNNALGTASSNDVVYWVSHGHNFQVGSAMVGIGIPTFTNATGSQDTSYPTLGAMVPQASAGGSSMLVNPGMSGGPRG